MAESNCCITTTAADTQNDHSQSNLSASSDVQQKQQQQQHSVPEKPDEKETVVVTPEPDESEAQQQQDSLQLTQTTQQRISKRTHKNYAWRSLSDVQYERYPEGMSIKISRPVRGAGPTPVPSEQLLKTKLLDKPGTEQLVGRLCGHFHLTGECLRGAQCDFAHHVKIDPKAEYTTNNPASSMPTEVIIPDDSELPEREVQLKEKIIKMNRESPLFKQQQTTQQGPQISQPIPMLQPSPRQLIQPSLVRHQHVQLSGTPNTTANNSMFYLAQPPPPQQQQPLQFAAAVPQPLVPPNKNMFLLPQQQSFPTAPAAPGAQLLLQQQPATTTTVQVPMMNVMVSYPQTSLPAAGGQQVTIVPMPMPGGVPVPVQPGTAAPRHPPAYAPMMMTIPQ